MFKLADSRLNIADAARLAVAAARAAAGDYTGIAVEGVRHARKIAAIVVSIIIGILVIFTVVINTLTSLIPGFDRLYDIFRKSEPPACVIDYTSTWQSMGTCENIYFPVPAGYEYSLPENDGKCVKISVSANTPVIAVEDSKVIKTASEEIELESIDELRKYRYRFSGIDTIEEENLSRGSIIACTGREEDEGMPVYTVKFEMWMKDKNRWVQIEPYQFLRLLSVNRYVLPGGKEVSDD